MYYEPQKSRVDLATPDGALSEVGVTVMVPALSVNLLLLSRTTHPAVLINTNAWHRYGELKSGCFKRVLDATNFATCLRSRRVGSKRLFTPRNPS